MAAGCARDEGRRLDRFQLGSILQPLFQQQLGRRTVQTAAAITLQAVALSSSPAAAVFIHPGKWQLQGSGKAHAVSTAVFRLRRQGPLGIQGKTHHESLNTPADAMFLQHLQICVERSAVQGRQGGHTDPQRITACQADAPATDVETENGADCHQDQRRPVKGVGIGV